MADEKEAPPLLRSYELRLPKRLREKLAEVGRRAIESDLEAGTLQPGAVHPGRGDGGSYALQLVIQDETVQETILSQLRHVDAYHRIEIARRLRARADELVEVAAELRRKAEDIGPGPGTGADS